MAQYKDSSTGNWIDKSVSYHLQVFVGDIGSDRMLHYLEIDQPLPPYKPGDFINRRFGTSDGLAKSDDGPLYRVISIEHGITEHPNRIVFSTMVFTTPVPDTSETRGF